MLGRRARRRGVLTALLVAGLVLLGLLGVAWLGQRSLLYYPDRADPGPAAAALPGAQDVELHTADGLRLRAWLVRPTSPDRRVAVLYAAGNGGNRAGRTEVAAEAARLGLTTLLLDYRGYGGNPGKPTEDGLAADARAAAKWLRDNGFAADRTIYVGESLGTGVVVRLATTDRPAAVVLRSPYTSMADMAHSLYPVVPTWFVRDRYDSLALMPQVKAPVRVLYGEADELVPPDQSRAIAAAAPELLMSEGVPRAMHNDPFWFGPYLAERISDTAADTIGD